MAKSPEDPPSPVDAYEAPSQATPVGDPSPAPFEPDARVDPYGPSTPPPPPPAPPAPPYSATGYAPGYAPAYQPGVYAPPPPRGLAIASLVTGIAGAFFSLFYGFGFLPSLAAVITGHIARKRQPHAAGMALAGLICGYVGLAISLLWFVGIILFIVFIAANPSYNSDF